MTIEEAITKMLTCATDQYCKREEACFLVAKTLKEMMAQSRSAAIPEDDSDTVSCYAPDWENSRWAMS